MQEEPFSTGEFFTIEQLAREADTSVRTIRYYTQEGLLPPPDARGRYALYTEAHRNRLKGIQRLKDAFLPLWAIKAQLQHWTDAEVAEFLSLGSEWEQTALQILQKFVPPEQRPQPPTDPNTAEGAAVQESAVAYIARVLAGKKRSSEPPILSRALPPLPPASVRRKQSPSVAPFAPAPAADVKEPPAQAPLNEPAKHAQTGAEAEEAKEKGSDEKEEKVGEETWLRIPLTPELELHARLPLSYDTERHLAAIRTAFRLNARIRESKQE